MNLFKYILLGTGLLWGLVSCEMKDELFGQNGPDGATGLLSLALDVDASTNQINTKASYDEVAQFPVIIYNSDNEIVKSYTSYSEVEEVVELPIGTYTVEAHSPGEFEQEMSHPYFGGTESLKIEEGITNNAEIICKMQNLPIKINYDATFLAAFASWTITVSDGASNILTFETATSSPGTVYWKLNENVTQITVEIDATTTTGEQIHKTNVYTKENADESYNNDNPNFVGGDKLDIYFTKEDSETRPGVEIGIKVDITFADADETTEIPVDDNTVIDPNPTPTPEGTPSIESTYLESGIVYSISAGDAPKDASITIKAPAGMKSVVATITGGNSGFGDVMNEMGFNNGIDLIANGEELNALFEEVQVDITCPTANATEYNFPISSFFSMMEIYGATDASNSHKFQIVVTDNNDESASGTLSVTINE